MRARCGGGAAAWVAGVLAAPGTQGVGGSGGRKHSALEGYGNQNWPVRPSVLAWRTPCLTEKPGMPGHSVQGRRVGHNRSDPASACTDARLFLPVAALPQ